MPYPRYQLKEELQIRNIITFFYRELPVRYHSPGESHNFWELVYVDKGQIEVTVDNVHFHLLRQGDIIFYSPDEFHRGRILHNIAPNLLIISFECTATCMRFFAGKHFRLRQEERNLLVSLAKEGQLAFDPPIDSPRMIFPQQAEQAPFGSEQIIRNYLEILLLSLIRHGETITATEKPALTTTTERQVFELTEQVIQYMQTHLSDKLTINELCNIFAVNATKLKRAFSLHTGSGVIEYFHRLQVNHAKTQIRESDATITEIAEGLGYSLHHFSRKFKQITGMSPMDYARSIKARLST